jgi:hypothetical protein
VPVTSWCIVCAHLPFFWLEILSVPSVASRNSVSSGSERGKIVFPFQKMTSQTRNCFVWRRFFFLGLQKCILRSGEDNGKQL